MTPSVQLEVDRHLPIGPLPDVYEHGPVAVIEEDEPTDGVVVMVCLDCGYATDDLRRYLAIECDREKNGINQTWRELIEKDGYPDYYRW